MCLIATAGELLAYNGTIQSFLFHARCCDVRKRWTKCACCVGCVSYLTPPVFHGIFPRRVPLTGRPYTSHLTRDTAALQDDFRSLFTANEKLKTEYKSLQSDYKSLKTENNTLKLKQTEVSGQMCDNRDHINSLEVEISKLSNRCEVS